MTLHKSFQPQRKDTAICVQEKNIHYLAKQQVFTVVWRLKTCRVILRTLCKVTFLLEASWGHSVFTPSELLTSLMHLINDKFQRKLRESVILCKK